MNIENIIHQIKEVSHPIDQRELEEFVSSYFNLKTQAEVKEVETLERELELAEEQAGFACDLVEQMLAHCEEICDDGKMRKGDMQILSVMVEDSMCEF